MQINRYENGRVLPSIENLVAIAEALNVSLDYLVAATDDPRGAVTALSPEEQRLVTNARNRDVPALLREVIALSEQRDQGAVAGADEGTVNEVGTIGRE
jgi:transcriptional regulator with XRE-family HTH domain